MKLEATQAHAARRTRERRRSYRLAAFLERLEDRQLLSVSPEIPMSDSLQTWGISTSASAAPLYSPELVPIASDNLTTDVMESLPRIGLPDFHAHSLFSDIRGQGTAVVIIDTGIDVNHPFFGPDTDNNGVADRIVYQYDYAGSDFTPDPDANVPNDGNEHGTHVSSIVASQDPFFPGVAPETDIIHLKVFLDYGGGLFVWLEQALQWVVANASTYNIASVNMSLGDGGNYNTTVPTQALLDYGITDELQALNDQGVISVASAGNRYAFYAGAQGLNYPASDPNALSVGATYDIGGVGFVYGSTTATACVDCITPFSQRSGTILDVFAPGAPITAADIDANPNDGITSITSMHGTSQSAPHVSGMAALAQQLAQRALGRKLTVAEFRNLLVDSGDTINDGDDEVDSVPNTNLDFSMVNMENLGFAIVALRDPQPTATGASSVNEGASYTLDLAAIEQGDGVIASWTINWGDGSSETILGNPSSATHTYADGAITYSVVATVTDQYGSYSADPLSVNVLNVAPAVTISGATTVAEGAAYALSLSATGDPGDDTIISWTIDWGDGTTPEVVSGNPPSVSHVFADDAASYLVQATATDEDGNYLSNVLNIEVSNVAPTIAIDGASTVNEGATYSLTLLSSDPGDDTISSWTIDWGDGSDPELITGNPSTASHDYADDHAGHTISATATDEDGTYSASSIHVAVLNVAPSLAIAGAASIDEGSEYVLTLSAVDPGADTITQWNVNWGDGSVETITGNPASITHTYADGANNYGIAAQATDEDGTFLANALAIAVINVAPTLTISGPPAVITGQMFSIDLSATDPGADTITSWTINWGDGNIETFSGHPASVTHAYASAAASHTIVATATDEDGTYPAANTLTVVVTDVAIIGDELADEGDTYVLTLAVAAPVLGSITGWTIDWGDGDVETVSGNPASVGHIFADGPNDYLISAAATDGSQTYPAIPISVAVQNVAPTLVVTGLPSVDEGDTYTLEFSSTDPGADTIASWIIDWGDGQIETLSGSHSSWDHTYADGPNAYTVQVTAMDEDGEYDAAPHAVSVSDVGPTLLISGAAEVAEGAPYILSLSVTDPGTEVIAEWSIDWGDGNTETISGNPSTASHIYADGDNHYTIAAMATNEDGTYASNTISVDVTDVAPTLAIDGPPSVIANDTYTLQLEVSDPGADTITGWTIDWGDGNVEFISGSPATVDHIYVSAPASHTISASAADEDGVYSAGNTINVSISNLAIHGAETIDEGAVFSLELTTSTSISATITGWTIHWGDGHTDNVSGNPSSINHIYADGPNAYTISASATNGIQTFVAVPIDVAVSNVEPSFLIGGLSSVDEGTVYTLNLAAIDPGDDTIVDWTINWGDGNTETIPGNATVATHIYADGPNSYSISVSAEDDDGTYAAGTVGVFVNNVAPTLVISGPGTIDEGALYTLNLSSNELGTDSIQNWTIDWGDGSNTVVEGNPSSVTHVYADGDQNVTITATATDQTGTYDANSLSVSVINVAPTVAISGAATTDEGALYTLQLSADGDPGDDTIASWTIDWGDGSSETILGNPSSATHTYADGTASYTIGALATDEDSSYVANAVEVTVHNVHPNVTITGDANVDEGAEYTLNLSAVDPGNDVISSWTIDWGDGNTEVISGSPTAVTHVYPDGTQVFHIQASATDEDGSYNAATLTLTVDNVAPTLAIGGVGAIDEGSTYTLNIATSDPGPDTITNWSIDWGDGNTETVVGTPASLTHLYADGNQPYTIVASATDEDGTYSENSILFVFDVAPTLTLGGIRSAIEGVPYRLPLSSVDPGNDPITGWTIDWGDGSIETITGNPLSVTHVYADGPRPYIIRASATNDDGTFSAPDSSVFVHLSALVADLNEDGSVDAADAGLMFGNWAGRGIGDITTDAVVDAADAGVMLTQWTGDAMPTRPMRSFQFADAADIGDDLLDEIAEDIAESRWRST